MAEKPGERITNAQSTVFRAADGNYWYSDEKNRLMRPSESSVTVGLFEMLINNNVKYSIQLVVLLKHSIAMLCKLFGNSKLYEVWRRKAVCSITRSTPSPRIALTGNKAGRPFHLFF